MGAKKEQRAAAAKKGRETKRLKVVRGHIDTPELSTNILLLGGDEERSNEERRR